MNAYLQSTLLGLSLFVCLTASPQHVRKSLGLSPWRQTAVSGKAVTCFPLVFPEVILHHTASLFQQQNLYLHLSKAQYTN